MFSSFSSLIIAFALCWKVTSDAIKMSLCWKLWSYFGVCRKVGSFIQTHCHLICQILSTEKLQKFIGERGEYGSLNTYHTSFSIQATLCICFVGTYKNPLADTTYTQLTYVYTCAHIYTHINTHYICNIGAYKYIYLLLLYLWQGI